MGQNEVIEIIVAVIVALLGGVVAKRRGASNTGSSAASNAELGGPLSGGQPSAGTGKLKTAGDKPVQVVWTPGQCRARMSLIPAGQPAEGPAAGHCAACAGNWYRR